MNYSQCNDAFLYKYWQCLGKTLSKQPLGDSNTDQTKPELNTSVTVIISLQFVSMYFDVLAIMIIARFRVQCHTLSSHG